MALKLIKLKGVMAMTSLSRSAIYQFMIDRDVPKQAKLTGCSVAWEEGEVQAWVEGQLAPR
jgi:prophage regulatory protein